VGYFDDGDFFIEKDEGEVHDDLKEEENSNQRTLRRRRPSN
jgi:hypothetical protein